MTHVMNNTSFIATKEKRLSSMSRIGELGAYLCPLSLYVTSYRKVKGRHFTY